MMEWLVTFLLNLMLAMATVASQSSFAAAIPPDSIVAQVRSSTLQEIVFADPNRANQLNPEFVFERSISERSRFDVIVNPGMLTLTAGPDDLTGPSACYPMSGNFAAEVYLRFEPTSTNAQGMGLFVRETGNWRTHLGIVRRVDGRFQQLATPGRDSSGEIDALPIEYLATGVFLKIERRGDLFTLEYQDGMREEWKALRRDFEFELPAPVEVCLNVWSGDAIRGLTGAFGEFRLGVPEEGGF